MEKTVYKIKNDRMDHWRKQKKQAKPAPEKDWICAKIEKTQMAIGEGPIGDSLVAGENRHSDGQRMEHIVKNLIPEAKTTTVGGKRLFCKPACVALYLVNIEVEMYTAVQD
jgi:hypothetical protein